jgi:integrase
MIRREFQRWLPKSVNNFLTVLRKLLTVGVEWGHIDNVPAFKWLRVPQQPFDFLDFEERLLAGAAPEWRPMMLLAMKTGLRLGELLALRREDVDLVAGRLVVRRNLVRGKFTTPKNGRMSTGAHHRGRARTRCESKTSPRSSCSPSR